MTTGRINQVASINNFAHRRLHATTNGEQASHGGKCHSRQPRLKGLHGRISHVSSHAPHPREQRKHVRHNCFKNDSQTWNTCITSRSPRTPSRRSGWTRSDKPHEYHSRGSQHRNRNHATKRDVRLKQDCMPTVRCKSMEPASKNNPNTTHTPSRTVDPTPLNVPHPAMPRQASKWKHRAAPCLHR